MRPRLPVFLLLVAACSSGGGPVSTTTTTGAVAPTASIESSTTTATGPPTTTTTTTTTLPPLVGLTYTEIASGLPFPVLLTFRPSDGQNFILTKNGQVWILTEGGPELFLDISDRVTSRGERGLLGMAWHPTDPRRLFLHYSDLNGDTAISEFVDGDERFVLRADQPASNHNGGMIEFGPDGYLFIGLGDGGGGGDIFGTGQRFDDLLASLLRIDVDSGDPYSIPDDNPYADASPDSNSGAPEVWAGGLRNPWRFSFDGDLIYIADVGQNAFEEINVAPANAPGLNYGWPVSEGLHCFDPPAGCDTSAHTLPVLEVPHGDGGACSITGGVVYRGQAIPELVGHYLFSDYCGGYLRSFLLADGVPTESRDWTGQVGGIGAVVSFGQGADGEVYIMNTETVYRVDPVR